MASPTPAGQGTYPSDCARATSASEARFRIDAPIAPARAARIIALDDEAGAVARRVAAGGQWANARFSHCDVALGDGRSGSTDRAGEVLLRGLDGSSATLSEELPASDVVVLLAAEDTGAAFAAAIGMACAASGIMTAGVVLADGSEVDAVVAALRPYARVLLPSAEESDVVELLTALRV